MSNTHSTPKATPRDDSAPRAGLSSSDCPAAPLATQIAGVFVLPLSIGAMIYLVNLRDLMGPYRAGWILNIGLIMSFLFSIYITYTGYIAIAERLRHLL